jgi:sporulation protein YlmC with PRC-barrel domain
MTKGGDNSLLTASNLLGATVYDAKNEKVGLLVNVMFDYQVSQASLLVFPGKTMKIWKKLTEFVQGTAMSYIEENFPQDYPEIAKKVSQTGTAQAFKIIDEYLKEKELDLLNIYYLVPLNKIVDPGDGPVKKVRLKEEIDNCDNYRCKSPETEDFPFFDARPFRNLDTLQSPTLNLPTIEGLKMTAPNGKKGKIVGLTLNYNANGSVENLIVETYGKNAGTHYVDLEDFEFSELVAKKMSSKP